MGRWIGYEKLRYKTLVVKGDMRKQTPGYFKVPDRAWEFN
jgi:hypothetical protein